MARMPVGQSTAAWNVCIILQEQVVTSSWWGLRRASLEAEAGLNQ